ncbi:acyltransferase [Phenylobacterium sp.]|jgi:peptidoglycan/LPS O-acetylase OafA/YrhL|uniref:acyltransferase n=1 Tax=Phenylobacterium sp. TaxID=1871053 RepID=UPI002E2FDE35|nr:acyltransferase [Phenylobacterium sp.]HEX2560228.1 acyltransferase [Phenylobacterium sp.]
MSRPKIAVEDSVNGLRGLALLLIVTTHYVPSGLFSFNLAKPTASVLFVATGYFLTSILTRFEAQLNGGFGERARAAAAIFGLRHVRVWPVLACVIGFYVVLGLVDRGPLTSQILTTWPLYLGYMGNVPKMLFEGQAFPAHFWLISAQEQLVAIYLLVALVFGLRTLKALLWWMIPLSLGARVLGGALLMPEHPALALETPLAVADALSIGMLLGFAVRGQVSRTTLRRLAVGLGIGVLMVWAMLPNLNAVYFSLAPFGVALLACALVLTVTDELRADSVHAGLLGSPLLVVCGQMSLSLFLLHPLVNTVLTLSYPKLAGAIMPWWLLLIVGPPLSLLVSFVFFRLVEVPVRRARGLVNPAPLRPAAA